VLKKGWIPLWVRPNDDPNAGNQALLTMGAHPAPAQASTIDLSAVLAWSASERSPRAAPSSLPASDHSGDEDSDSQAHPSMPAATLLGETDSSHSNEQPPKSIPDVAEIDFFQLFVAKAQPLCATAPRTPDELAEAFALSKTQVNQWVKQAVAEKKLSKLSKPVRYGAPNDAQGVLRFE
jgi:hypothetical protein